MSFAVYAICAAALFRLCASKGCFIKTSPVRMADGSSKQLQQMQIGDEVASWDESAQKLASSTVQAVPVFERSAADMIEVNLTSSSRAIYATADHPFWSRGRQTLVSMHPNMSKEEYGLEVSLLNPQDTLENDLQQPVHIASIRQSGNTLLSNVKLEVMTLCLWPHHWYYVEGVRVHNKGCFVPWTPVLMQNGGRKAIRDVVLNEKVVSWDFATQRHVEAKVIGIDIFPANDLMELTYNVSRRGARELSSGSNSELGSQSLVLTKDHPIWSAEQQHLVSMAPDVTKTNYGLNAKQLKAGEKLHHHTGEHVPAEARPWAGNTSHVMTLRLETHHWFYANGILVHNKGGGGRSSSGGRSSGSSGTSSKVSVSRTRSTMGTRSYVGFIFISSGSRRRYGTYHQEPGSKCTLQSPAHIDNSCKNFIYNSNVGSNFFLDSNCQRTESDPARAQMGLETKQICIDATSNTSNTSLTTAAPGQLVGGTPPLPPQSDCHCCHTCMACTTQSCVDAIKGPETGGCEEFLADVYSQCTDEEDGAGIDGGVVLVIVLIFFGIGIAVCCCCACNTFMNQNHSGGGGFSGGSGGGGASTGELHQRRAARENLQPFCCKGDLAMQLNGTYTENGETKPTSYNLTIMSGRVGGTAQDDDGQAQVNGTVNWPVGAEQGTIMWVESSGHDEISLEAQGSLTQTNDGMFVIESNYVSDYQGTRGTTRVMSAPVSIPVTQGTVVQGTVVGVPANSLPGQPREECEQATVVSAPVPAPQTMQVQCPHGVGPGGTIQTNTPAGQAIQVQVPAGVQPGASFTIQY